MANFKLPPMRMSAVRMSEVRMSEVRMSVDTIGVGRTGWMRALVVPVSPISTSTCVLPIPSHIPNAENAVGQSPSDCRAFEVLGFANFRGRTI